MGVFNRVNADEVTKFKGDRCVCHLLQWGSVSPWLNWIARRPPKAEVTGSNPVGDALNPRSNPCAGKPLVAFWFVEVVETNAGTDYVCAAALRFPGFNGQARLVLGVFQKLSHCDLEIMLPLPG